LRRCDTAQLIERQNRPGVIDLEVFNQAGGCVPGADCGEFFLYRLNRFFIFISAAEMF